MGEVMHPVFKLQNGVRTPTVSTKWMWGRSHGFQRSGNQARVTKTTFCQPNPTYKTVSHPNSHSKTGWQPNSSYNVVSKQVLLTKREYPSFASICQRYLLMCLPRSFFWFKGIVCLLHMYSFSKDTKRFSTHALLTKTVWEPGYSYNTVSNQVLLTKRLSTQALLTKRYRSQARVTEKTLWPSLATKLYVQTGVAPMLFVQNGLATRL